MKVFLPIIATLLMPTALYAHVGHLGELAAHDHWVAGAAIGAAAAVTLWGALKGKTSKSEETAEEDNAEEETA